MIYALAMVTPPTSKTEHNGWQLQGSDREMVLALKFGPQLVPALPNFNDRIFLVQIIYTILGHQLTRFDFVDDVDLCTMATGWKTEDVVT